MKVSQDPRLPTLEQDASIYQRLLNVQLSQMFREFALAINRIVDGFLDSLILPKDSGAGIKVDLAAPTWGWRDITASIHLKGVGATDPDFAVYRTNGAVSISQFRFTNSGTHIHEAWINFHIPHDYVPGTDIFIHAHWSQIVVDTGGTAGIPGVVEWNFDISYADGHGTAGGAADPFIAPFKVTVTQQASTTAFGHMIAEVQVTGASLAASTIQVDGLLLARIWRDSTATADTLNQDPFLHFVDLHYQSTNMATKQKAPNFYV